MLAKTIIQTNLPIFQKKKKSQKTVGLRASKVQYISFPQRKNILSTEKLCVYAMLRYD